MTEITQAIAAKVLEVVDAGLVSGLGQSKPGRMCVEAAVCYALGLPHGDDPECVSRALRSLKIRLNDSRWSSDAARAKGLRRLAVIQLGSRTALNDMEFVKRVSKMVIQKMVPIALRAAASIHSNPKHMKALRDAANRCEVEDTKKSADAAAYAADAADANAATYAAAAAAAYAADAAAKANATKAYAAYAAAYAADAADAAAYATKANATKAKRDDILAEFAEAVVQILIDMKVPGVQWLPLTEL